MLFYVFNDFLGSSVGAFKPPPILVPGVETVFVTFELGGRNPEGPLPKLCLVPDYAREFTLSFLEGDAFDEI